MSNLQYTTPPQLWGDKRFHTWNYEMREHLNTKVFKVMLDAGFTCPNRDGSIAKGGCTFAVPEVLVILREVAEMISSPNLIISVTSSI